MDERNLFKFKEPFEAKIFGLFYEEIIFQYLKNVKQLNVIRGKPKIFIDDIPKEVADTTKFSSREYFLLDGFIDLSDKEGIKCCYVYEAKCWSLWNETLRDLIQKLPQMYAGRCYFNKEPYDVKKFILFWCPTKGEQEQEIEKIEEEVNNKLKQIREKRQNIKVPEVFSCLSIFKIIVECLENKNEDQYKWFSDVINNNREKINRFFNKLY